MRRRVARMGPDGEFEGLARLVVLTLRGVQHGEVVVRLGEFREFLGERREHLDGVRLAAEFRVDHALEKAGAGVLRLLREHGVHAVHGTGEVALAEEASSLLEIVGDRMRRKEREEG